MVLLVWLITRHPWPGRGPAVPRTAGRQHDVVRMFGAGYGHGARQRDDDDRQLQRLELVHRRVHEWPDDDDAPVKRTRRRAARRRAGQDGAVTGSLKCTSHCGILRHQA